MKRIEIDDPLAERLLRERLSALKIEHSARLAINRAKRKKMPRDAALGQARALGVDDQTARSIYASPAEGERRLRVLATSIRRYESRLALLDEIKGAKRRFRTLPVIGQITYFEDRDDFRWGFIFSGATPEPAARYLSRRGFRFSPTRERWQRKIAEGFRMEAKRIRSYFQTTYQEN